MSIFNSFGLTWEYGDLLNTLPAIMKPVAKDHTYKYWTQKIARKGSKQVKHTVPRFPIQVKLLKLLNHALRKQTHALKSHKCTH